jgi:Ca2+-transporting ATPase
LSQDLKVTVTRGGEKSNISIYSLLVGDVIKLNTGDRIPADCILYTGNQVTCDESALTGEPKHILKNPINDLEKPNEYTDATLLGGTTIMSGTGVAIVCAVGSMSVQGKINAKIMVEDNSETPL